MTISNILLGSFFFIASCFIPAWADSENRNGTKAADMPGEKTDHSKKTENTSPGDFGDKLKIDSVKIGGLWYLSYQHGNSYSGTVDQTASYSTFRIKRGYLNIRADLQPWLEVRITPDVTQDATGDLKVRLKYLYAKFKAQGNNILNKPYIEVGVVHMPWLDFEEHINRFRMQDTMFMERNHLFNSADMGFTVGSNFGRELPEEYRENVNDHYAGRYGSWQFGIYNGGGYHASEKNRNKVVEGRGTLRPLPNSLPGFQVSLFGIHGKVNLPDPDAPAELPDYRVLAGMISYEHKYFVLSGQWHWGEGNASGTASNPDGRARPHNGSSYFSEVRFTAERNLSFIWRYDRFRTDADDPQSDLHERLILGFAWQMFKKNYWLVDYDRLMHSIAGISDEDRVQVTLQISF